ncbi:Mitochondrial import inner membrane translocase subunit TIM44-2-like protein [Drosera capensis]
MAGRKLARDFLFSKQPLFRQFVSRYQLPEVRNSRWLLIRADANLCSHRRFSVFNEFSKKLTCDAERSKEFQKTIKELKVKAEELKGVKEEQSILPSSCTSMLTVCGQKPNLPQKSSEHSSARVSANVKEKISAAKEEVKETLGIGKQESSSSMGSSSTGKGSDAKDGSKAKPRKEQQQSGSADDLGKLFGKFKSSVSSASPKILHISEADVRETKMMGSMPIIILMFQTQQVHCVRDSDGNIAGKDTIHTVYYAWAMQQLQPDELEKDGIYSMWRLREMQQLGIEALI